MKLAGIPCLIKSQALLIVTCRCRVGHSTRRNSGSSSRRSYDAASLSYRCLHITCLVHFCQYRWWCLLDLGFYLLCVYCCFPSTDALCSNSSEDIACLAAMDTVTQSGAWSDLGTD
ncbi:hypothetical protein E2C01_038317 [Portunus trituberculatus]|uniref:Uncharacterized protein n=1 Tax=Portunus trituberculatus TaxID=210409 RepID=A0A5B7FAJ7_PORTR|nr:hypothetical protein [Portunus trituberculatus]